MSADEQAMLALAGAAGIAIPAEDIDPLLAALRNNLEAARTLAEIQLADDEPIVEFDPRWL